MLDRTLHDNIAVPWGSSSSGVSWGAILAGAFAAAALSFILIILGFGLGFSSVSPWSGSGLRAQAIGYSTIGWVAFTQIAASAIGGYMAGRLRVKWANIHNDEVYFRDTAHGFLAWAVASLATAALLTSAIGGVLTGGAKVVSSAGAAVVAAGGAMASDATSDNELSGYFVDALLRTPVATAAAVAPANGENTQTAAETLPASRTLTDNARPDVTPAQRAEVLRIYANALRIGSLPAEDKAYLSRLLASHTGMAQNEAEKRVNASYTAYKQNIDEAAAKTKDAAEKARKAAAYGSLWMFVALLCGAFIASFAATYGGRLRDRMVLDVEDPRVPATVQPVTHS